MSDSNVLGKPLTVLQQRFCKLYDGNGIETAKKAGYKGNRSVLAGIARKNLQDPRIVAIIQDQQKRDAEDIADREERQRFWTRVMRGRARETVYTRNGKSVIRAPKMSDRLKAAELLGKCQCDFVERREIIDKTPVKKIQIELVRPGDEEAIQTKN